jgi:hypothetical protein
MGADFKALKHHIDRHIQLDENEWNNVLSLVQKKGLKKNWKLSAKPGDIFHIVSGFLVEYQYTGTTDFRVIRFFQENEIFVFPSEYRNSEIFAIKATFLLHIKAPKKNQHIKELPNFHKFCKVIKKLEPEKYERRQQFLQGKRPLRYQLFIKAFPNVANILSSADLGSYLDINPSYLSTIKKL